MAGSPLEDSMTDDGPEVYYNLDFRNVIEDHLELIKKAARTSYIGVDVFLANVNKGSFYSLLSQLSTPIPKQLHWITLRLNGLTSPHEYDGRTSILLPDNEYIETLVRTFLSKKKSL